MQKNIIYITGNDSYGIELEVMRWLGAFQNKFGNINIDHYDLSDTPSLKGIGDIVLMSGLFVEKRLFIFRGGRDRKSKTLGLENILEEKLSDIPDEHFLLFHNISEKEEGLLHWLQKNADVRNINTIWDMKVWITRTHLDENTLKIILNTYREAEIHREKGDINTLLGHEIANTTTMISLLEKSGKQLNTSEIIGLCYTYDGDTMFSLIDAIMTMNTPLCIDIFHRIAGSRKVDEWLGSMIGLLRNNIYIKYLKHHGSTEADIATILKIHPYVLKKSYSARISYSYLKEIYEKLISTNIAYKRGKGLKDSELGRILSIELALLGLQKTKNT